MRNKEYEKENNLLATPLYIVLYFTFFILISFLIVAKPLPESAHSNWEAQGSLG